MADLQRMGRAGLQGWRTKVADGVATPAAKRTPLSEDQVRALSAHGIPATFLASSLPREENARRLAGLRRGAYKIVYAAPERLAFDGFLDALESVSLSLLGPWPTFTRSSVARWLEPSGRG